MLKLRIALCLALVVGTLTLTNSILHGARVETIIYRVVISVGVFGFAGYCLGFGVESFLTALVAKDTGQDQQIDIINEQSNDEPPAEAPFSPFTSGNFEQISRPKE